VFLLTYRTVNRPCTVGVLSILIGVFSACGEPKVPSEETVGLRFSGEPPTARVVIDDQPVGELGDVVARGVRVRTGKHRISVEAQGYFPSDQLLDAQGQIVKVSVTLRKLPD
jgi:hypothetical protein